VLVVGGVASAMPGVGLARLLHAGAGYADFGYVPQQCGASTRSTQAINGDVIRVCTNSRNLTYGFFAGHSPYPLAQARLDLQLALPDENRSFWCCGGSSTSQYPGFSAPVFDGVTLGNPLVGVSRTTASPYAQITKVLRLNPGASGYTATYAITNTKGAPLKIRALVRQEAYGYYGPPQLSTSSGPRTIRFRNPVEGGSVAISESTVDGSPAVVGFTAGYWQRTDAYTVPSAPPLDNQLHDDGQTGAEAMLAWAPVTLAANETRRYSVSVALQQPRELQLKLQGAAPSAGAPTLLAAAVTDDRGVAGRIVRWSVKRRAPVSGTATLDGAGNAVLSIPPAVGGGAVRAYVDDDNDGTEDLDEPAAYGELWTPQPDAPAPGPGTAAPGATVAVATPTPVAPKPVAERILVTLSFDYKNATKRFTRLTRLVVKNVPKGATVTATCKKGCAKKSFVKRNASGTVSLSKLIGKRLKAGTVIKVVVSQPGKVSATKTLKIRAGKRPKAS
jgi:hypothetical protein